MLKLYSSETEEKGRQTQEVKYNNYVTQTILGNYKIAVNLELCCCNKLFTCCLVGSEQGFVVVMTRMSY